MRKDTHDWAFRILMLVSQVFAVIFYGVYFKHIFPTSGKLADEVADHQFRYPYFQDVHIMIYLGFGFLLCFIHKCKLTSLVSCYWTAAITVQFYFLFNFCWMVAFESKKDFHITMEKLILGEVSGAAVLIAVCAIVGKTNNLQFLIIALFGSFMYTLNEYIVTSKKLLECRDVGGSMIIHAFGAFYGLGITRFLNYKSSYPNKNLVPTHTSYTFGMLGTIFLWCFWPSFNAALAATQQEVQIAVLNTYFSIIGSCLGAFACSTFLFNGKYNMDHVLNATLAGGVVMGAGADLINEGYVAYLVGFGIGIVSCLLFQYAPDLLLKIGFHDVAGVFNLHAVPGTVGGLLSAIFMKAYNHGNGGKQVAGTFISVGMGLFGGMLIGACIRGFGYYGDQNDYFNDIENAHLEPESRENLQFYGLDPKGFDPAASQYTQYMSSQYTNPTCQPLMGGSTYCAPSTSAEMGSINPSYASPLAAQREHQDSTITVNAPVPSISPMAEFATTPSPTPNDQGEIKVGFSRT